MTDAKQTNAGRIALPTLEELTPEQRRKFEERATPPMNLGRLLDLAPAMGPKVLELNLAMANDIALPSEEREIVALATLNLERGEYELVQHREVVKMMGIPQAKADAIAQERYGDPIFTDRERALLNFTRQVVRSVRVDDPTFAAVAAFYDRRQLVETLLVIGNYMMLVRVSEATELPIDSSAGAAFWNKDKK